MDTNPLQEVLRSARYGAAACIATGGLMHGLGMAFSVADGQTFPWWFWAIFFVALCGYFTSAALILKNRWPGYAFAVLGPAVGGALIFMGFIFPGSRLLILIPGTYTNEITWTGFITLVAEPVAVVLAALCLKHRVWETH